MSELEVFELLQWSWFGLAALVFISLQFISAPYGRHVREGWGPQVPDRVGWMIMEVPAVFTMPVFFFLGDHNAATIVFITLWELHYINRTFIYPFRTKSKGKRMPLIVALMGGVTNIAIGYLIGRWVFTFGGYDASWLYTPQFIAGLCVFAVGFATNNHADHVLLNLRKPGETGYKIPFGGAYRWVSCPNYFGEILEWTGYAILTWSIPAAAFVAWTMANLVPRALTHHGWYREKFDGYPDERKAVFPFVL